VIARDYNINYYGRDLRKESQDDHEEDLDGHGVPHYKLPAEADNATVEPRGHPE
jgi:hypothetical protein